MDDNPYASREFLHQLLSKAVAAEASDVHLKVGQPPGVRVGGEIAYFKVDRLRPEDTYALARQILGNKYGTPDHMEKLQEHDTSYTIEGLGRFRVNVYKQRGTFAIVMRTIPVKVPDLDSLGLPKPIRDLAMQERGFVLVVGATGSGKTTTLAAMLNHINQTRPRNIVTIEDPIEFLHPDKRCCVSQREIGMDTGSFAPALRAALRQDPDVILVGEIRDSETVEIAVQAAETGHLVFSTMHTPDVGRTVNRLLALADNPLELRERIGDCLRGIVAQRLVPKAEGGLALCQEILIATGTVREAIKRPEANPPLKELMERGVTPYGMQTFHMAVKRLVKRGVITKETAQEYFSN